MKSKRSVLNLTDFSGGLFTNPPQTDVDTNENAPAHSPDCLNVYAEGKALRKRFGVTHINSTSAGTTGNGIYNWVLNASQQYLIALFDGTLKQMSLSGNTWSGSWVTVSADSAGTIFSNSLMHFVTYQGTLIMTTENRDKPQRMTVTDNKYKNLDYAGSGFAPLAKYPQVWKEHVFLLNISGGGALTEQCNSLSSWTTLDISTGVTTTSTFGGLQNFKFYAGVGVGSDAHIKQTLASITTSYSIELKTYFKSVSRITGGDYAYMDVANGVIRFRTRWSQDGLETYNGTAWLQVGVGLVSTGTWSTWKYLVTAGTATAAYVDVFKDGAPVGLQFYVGNVSVASSGQIDLACSAGASGSRGEWYMDYIYLNPIATRANYFTDEFFNSWVGTTQATYTDNVLPTIPFLQYKLNDNAGNSTITDNGSGSSNAGIYADSTTINSSAVSVAGKIGTAISLTSASSHNIQLNTTSVTSMAVDTQGSLFAWIKNCDDNIFFSIGRATGIDNLVQVAAGTGISLYLSHENSVQLYCYADTTLATSAWNHIGIVQNGVSPSFYVNGSLVNTIYITSTDKTVWFSSLATIDNARIGCKTVNGLGNSNFLRGTLDDIRYYRTALTTSNIQALYGDGNGTEGQPVTVQEGTTFYAGTYSYRINNDGQYAVASQTITSSTAIAGNSLIMGAFINATNNSTYKLRINDGTTNYDSSIITANGTWQYQTLSVTPASNSTSVRTQVISLSTSTLYMDMVALVQASSGTIQDFSDRIERSQSGTYDTWTDGGGGASDDSGHNDITTPGDVGLTGSFILQDRMYVMKAWNIYRITYTNSIPLLDIKQARSVVGSRSPRAICNIDYPNYGEIVIFLGTDRNLYLFDGFASTPLSDDIQLNNNMAQVYTNNINSQALDKIFAINHSNIGCYEIFLPMGNSTTPNFSLFYNYKTKAFWPFSNRNYLSGAVSDDGNGNRVIVVVGASNGIAYEINPDKSTSDDGTAINAYWNSFKLGQDYILGKQDQIQVAGDSVTATPTLKWRTNYETSYATQTLSASSNQYVFDPAREANLIQFQIGDNSTGAIWKIWHIKGLERGIGIGG